MKKDKRDADNEMNEKKNKTLTFHAPDLTTRQELPVAGSTVRAGFPSPADDFLDTPLDLNRELVHNPASTFFVRVAGDTRINVKISEQSGRVTDLNLPGLAVQEGDVVQRAGGDEGVADAGVHLVLAPTHGQAGGDNGAPPSPPQAR